MNLIIHHQAIASESHDTDVEKYLIKPELEQKTIKAIQNGDTKTLTQSLGQLKKYLPSEANPADYKINGKSLLWFATYSQQYTIMKYLLRQEADVDILNYDTWEENDYFVEKYQTALHLASNFENSKALDILIEAGADVNILNDRKEGVLFVAVRSAFRAKRTNRDCVKSLLKTEANSEEAFEFAVVFEDTESIAAFCECGKEYIGIMGRLLLKHSS